MKLNRDFDYVQQPFKSIAFASERSQNNRQKKFAHPEQKPFTPINDGTKIHLIAEKFEEILQILGLDLDDDSLKDCL